MDEAMRVDFNATYPVLELPESFTISNIDGFVEAMDSIYEKGYNTISIAFTRVESIDSLGLGKIILFSKKLKENGGELRLIHLKNQRILKMFEMISLHKEIYIEGLSHRG